MMYFTLIMLIAVTMTSLMFWKSGMSGPVVVVNIIVFIIALNMFGAVGEEITQYNTTDVQPFLFIFEEIGSTHSQSFTTQSVKSTDATNNLPEVEETDWEYQSTPVTQATTTTIDYGDLDDLSVLDLSFLD